MSDHYHTLGIHESATQAEIKAAFKKLAVQYHPDKHAGHPQMEEYFKEINLAYQILSNPYEKARYDLKRQFGTGRAHTYNTTTWHDASYSPRRPRRPYVDPRINWRENWIATAYAFGFTIIVAIIVMSAIGIKQHLDMQALAEKLAERRSLFELVQTDYSNGKLEAAMIRLNDLGTFRESEKDMAEFKEHLYVEFLDKAERNYRYKNFGEAIYYYELILDYGPRTTQVLLEHLAESYHQDGQLQKAIVQYNQLLLNGYHMLNAYMSLALIHHVNLKNPEEALIYYELASEKAIEAYKGTYGDGYPLVISGRLIPPEHYYLYTGLAQAYLETGNPERAIKATKWNVNMWPDSTANYVIAAKGLFETGEKRQACYSLHIAEQLGYLGDPGFTCN